MPTFNRLKEKHPSAMMMWFQNGKLWPSRLDAQEAMRARGEMGRRGDERQGRLSRSRERPRARKARALQRSERPEWTPKPASAEPASPQAASRKRLETSSTGNRKANSLPRRSDPNDPTGSRRATRERNRSGNRRAPSIASASRDWKPKGKPRSRRSRLEAEGLLRIAIASLIGSRRDPSIASASRIGSRRDLRSRSQSRIGNRRGAIAAQSCAKPASGSARACVGDASQAGVETEVRQIPEPQAPSPLRSASGSPKRNTRSPMGIEAKRDNKWRPGGEHTDPRQKYKDAKKAKWTNSSRTSADAGTGSRGEEGRRQVIAHVVLFRPRRDADRRRTQALIERAAAAVDGIPRSSAPRSASASCSIVRAMKHKWPSTIEYSAILEFDSEADLRAYLDHPAHTDLGTLLFTSAEAVLAYDFRSDQPGGAALVRVRRCRRARMRA